MSKKVRSAGLKRLTPQDIRIRGHHIMKATILANELFKDTKKADRWMMVSNSQFFNDSPFEVILRGDGIHVLQYLIERLGRKSGPAF